MDPLEYANAKGHDEVVALWSSGRKWPRDEHGQVNCIYAAGAVGCEKMIAWANKLCKSESMRQQMMITAAGHGRVAMVKKLLAKGKTMFLANAADAAAAAGDLDMVKLLLDHPGGFFSKADVLAAANGHVHVIDWMYWNTKYFFYPKVINAAIAAGQVEVVRWWVDHGQNVCGATFNKAIIGGHAATLDVLMSKKAVILNLPDSLEAAAATGDVDKMRYLFEYGHIAPFRSQPNHMVEMMRGWRDPRITQPIASLHLQSYAATNGRVDVLQYLMSLGQPLQHDVLEIGVRNNHVNVVKFAQAHGQQLHARMPLLTVSHATITMLEWLTEHGCTNDATAQTAAENGNVAALRYLHGRGSPLTSAMMEAATSVDVLAYLCANGCAISERAMEQHKFHPKRLRLLCEHGGLLTRGLLQAAIDARDTQAVLCMVDNNAARAAEACEVAMESQSSQMLKVFIDRGCAWKPAVLQAIYDKSDRRLNTVCRLGPMWCAKVCMLKARVYCKRVLRSGERKNEKSMS